MLGTLRYANDQLGGFITRVKASPAGLRTIIAATGDHNILGVDYQNPDDAALARAVPFYVYARRPTAPMPSMTASGSAATRTSCRRSIS